MIMAKSIHKLVNLIGQVLNHFFLPTRKKMGFKFQKGKRKNSSTCVLVLVLVLRRKKNIGAWETKKKKEMQQVISCGECGRSGDWQGCKCAHESCFQDLIFCSPLCRRTHNRFLQLFPETQEYKQVPRDLTSVQNLLLLHVTSEMGLANLIVQYSLRKRFRLVKIYSYPGHHMSNIFSRSDILCDSKQKKYWQVGDTLLQVSNGCILGIASHGLKSDCENKNVAKYEFGFHSSFAQSPQMPIPRPVTLWQDRKCLKYVRLPQIPYVRGMYSQTYKDTTWIMHHASGNIFIYDTQELEEGFMEGNCSFTTLCQLKIRPILDHCRWCIIDDYLVSYPEGRRFPRLFTIYWIADCC